MNPTFFKSIQHLGIVLPALFFLLAWSTAGAEERRIVRHPADKLVGAGEEELGPLRPRGSFSAELIAAFLEEEKERSPKARIDTMKGSFPRQLIDQQDIPACDLANVRLEEVHDHTPGSEKLDVVFYEKSNSEELAKAKDWRGFKAAYEPLLFTRSDTGRPDVWQLLAHTLKLECLPTRFRFVDIASRRYMEFREGPKAWESK